MKKLTVAMIGLIFGILCSIIALAADYGAVKNDVSTIKKDITEIKNDVKYIRSDNKCHNIPYRITKK